jgi:hypothetical protein
MSEINIYELEAEHGQLLPEREALGTSGFSHKLGNIVVAPNIAVAVQVLSPDSENAAEADQAIDVS